MRTTVCFSSLAKRKDNFASRDYLHAVFPASAEEEHLVHVPKTERTADPSRTATTNWVLDGVVHLEVKGTLKEAIKGMRFFW